MSNACVPSASASDSGWMRGSVMANSFLVCVVSSAGYRGQRRKEARPTRGTAQIHRWSDGNYPARIHPRLTSVVVPLDVEEIDRLADAGQLVDILEPAPNVWIVPQVP